jgi:hypothetical protein
VVQAGELLEVARSAVRLAHLGGERHDARELLQSAEQRRLGLVGEQLGANAERSTPRRAALRATLCVRACAYCT